MQLNYNQKSKMPLIGTLGLLFSLASCGSYQYAGYGDDSVYGTSRTVEYQTETSNQAPSQNSTYYQNYFQEKSQELDYLAQEDVIFTDIDSYEGNYEVENDTLVEYEESYAGWGQSPSEVSINVYSGFGYGGYGYPYYGSYYSNWYYPYRNYGYGGFGFGFSGYGYPYYSYGYGYPYYGYGYSNYGYRYGYHHNNYYSRKGIAYNTGRRGSIYSNSNRSRLANRTSTSSRNSSTYRPRRTTNSNINLSLIMSTPANIKPCSIR